MQLVSDVAYLNICGTSWRGLSFTDWTTLMDGLPLFNLITIYDPKHAYLTTDGFARTKIFFSRFHMGKFIFLFFYHLFKKGYVVENNCDYSIWR